MYIKGQIHPFQYFGGKYTCLPWLLPLLPPTKSFVDVFGGSASVILNKEPSQINTYNDINGIVVNFFEQLRDSSPELIRLIELTPHSRFEYEHAWCDDETMRTISPVELARRFFVRTRQSFMATGAQRAKKGWMAATKESRVSISESTNKWLMSIEMLKEIEDVKSFVSADEHHNFMIIKNNNTQHHETVSTTRAANINADQH